MNASEFIKIMLADLNKSDREITIFCLDILSKLKKLELHLATRLIHHEKIRSKADLKYYHAPVFSGLVRIINPVNKYDIGIREVYLDSMIQDCTERNVRKVLVKGNEFEKSMLLKLIHEKNYELTTISEIRSITSIKPKSKPVHRRKFHLVRVRHQTEENQKELFLQQLASLTFEEVAFQAMKEKVPNRNINLLATINSPKSGDLLLSSHGEKYTVEVKCNKVALPQIIKSDCLYGIHSIQPDLSESIPSAGCLVGCRLLFRKNKKSEFIPRDITYSMPSQKCKLFDSSLVKVVRLSGIHVPRDLDLSFRTLMVGSETQDAGVPNLEHAFAFAEQAINSSWNSNSRNQSLRWQEKNNFNQEWHKTVSKKKSPRKKRKRKRTKKKSRSSSLSF